MGFGVISKDMLSTAILVIWLLLGLVFVRLFGFTPGQLALGLGVVSVGGRVPVGIGRLAVRGLLARAGGSGVVLRLGRARPA